MAINKELYQILGSGVNVYSTRQEIDSAYLNAISNLTKKVENEKVNVNVSDKVILHAYLLSAREKFSEIRKAYSVLSDVEKRKKYDEYLYNNTKQFINENFLTEKTFFVMLNFFLEINDDFKSYLNDFNSVDSKTSKDTMFKKMTLLKNKFYKLEKSLNFFIKSNFSASSFESETGTNFNENIHATKSYGDSIIKNKSSFTINDVIEKGYIINSSVVIKKQIVDFIEDTNNLFFNNVKNSQVKLDLNNLNNSTFKEPPTAEFLENNKNDYYFNGEQSVQSFNNSFGSKIFNNDPSSQYEPEFKEPSKPIYKSEDNFYKPEDNIYKSEDNFYKHEDDNTYKSEDNIYKYEEKEQPFEKSDEVPIFFRESTKFFSRKRVKRPKEKTSESKLNNSSQAVIVESPEPKPIITPTSQPQTEESIEAKIKAMWEKDKNSDDFEPKPTVETKKQKSIDAKIKKMQEKAKSSSRPTASKSSLFNSDIDSFAKSSIEKQKSISHTIEEKLNQEFSKPDPTSSGGSKKSDKLDNSSNKKEKDKIKKLELLNKKVTILQKNKAISKKTIDDISAELRKILR